MRAGQKSEIAGGCENLVSAAGLSKTYFRRKSALEMLRRALGPGRNELESGENGFTALKNVSFSLKKGELLGVIGENGAGKSTLLRILAGISAPTTGKVDVNGKVGAILELGSGFHPEFTGRRNIFLAGAVLGFSRGQITGRMDEIVDFAELGEFMDRPVREYSSGMFLRLAFAVHACLAPDLLLVDEVLSVGDLFFQQKCHRKMEEMLCRGTGMVLVSHDMAAVQKYCPRTLLLQKGEPVFLGGTSEAVGLYHRLHQAQARPGAEAACGPDNPTGPHHPAVLTVADEKKVRLKNIRLSGENGEEISGGMETGGRLCLDIAFEVLRDLETPVAALQIADRLAINVHGKSSLHAKVQVPPRVEAGSVLNVRQSVAMNLAPGEYSVGIGLGETGGENVRHAQNLETDDLESRIRYVFMARLARPVLILPKTDGLKKSFFGLADLPGTVELEIIEPKAT